MSYFLQSGDMFSPTPGKESVLNELPVGNYIVVETMQGLVFKRVDAFTDPGRMYGNINKRAERIMSTFMDRPRTTGVLLSGEKGSGKSQLARNVSRLGYDLGMPTILVNAPFYGDAFNALLATIEQPAIILMDEFEKVYSHDEHQEQVLTLLDGMMTSKKLFILTVNNKYRVNDHMKNRPGRIYYSIEFEGLETQFVREYCEENLNNQDQTENVLKISAMFKAFNFDMLKALVEEMNRYNESAFEAMDLLNAKPFNSDVTVNYDVTVVSPKGIKSVTLETDDIPLGGERERVGFYATFEKPTSDFDVWAAELGFNVFDSDDDSDESESDRTDFSRHFIVNGSSLKRIDVGAGRYEFEESGFTIIYKRKPSTKYSLHDLDF